MNRQCPWGFMWFNLDSSGSEYNAQTTVYSWKDGRKVVLDFPFSPLMEQGMTFPFLFNPGMGRTGESSESDSLLASLSLPPKLGNPDEEGFY